MKFTNLTNYLNYLVNEVNTPNVDCIVYKDHEMIFRHFAGRSDIEEDKDLQGDELYIIFSMTKMLTCTAALQLYEQGKYTMDEPISKYLPEFEKMKLRTSARQGQSSMLVAQGISVAAEEVATENVYAQNPIRVIDLFTMSAGLDYNVGAPYIKQALAEGKTSTRELVRAMAQTVLRFEPGTEFWYSLCHDVLGALIEIWSGRKLGEYMRENIFAPLGMNNTFFGLPTDGKRLSKMVAKYTFNEEGKPEKMPLECMFMLSKEYESGGAGLCSCTQDYALFLDALACGGMAKTGKRILKEETIKLMGTDQMQGKKCNDYQKVHPGYGYGLGVRVHKDPNQSGSFSPVGEFGWDGAAGCYSMVDTKNKISITYFQQIHAWNMKIQNGICNAVYRDIRAAGQLD